MLRSHLYPAASADSVSCIEYQVGHNALDLFIVSRDSGQRPKVPCHLDVRHPVDSVEGLGDEFIQIGADPPGVGPLAKSTQARDHVIDSLRRITDAAQRVLPKRGVVEMDRQILEHQIE